MISHIIQYIAKESIRQVFSGFFGFRSFKGFEADMEYGGQMENLALQHWAGAMGFFASCSSFMVRHSPCWVRPPYGFVVLSKFSLATSANSHFGTFPCNYGTCDEHFTTCGNNFGTYADHFTT